MSRHLAAPHFEDQAYRELARSRRHGRPMTILVFVAGVPARPRPWGRTPRGYARRLEELVRRYDVVSSFRGRVVVLCPELDPMDGARLAARLADEVQVPTGIASFPADGANLDTLLRLATDRATSLTPPSPPPVG